MGDSVRSRGEMLFSRDFMIQYMKDVDSMLNKLPLYSKLNSLYAGGDNQSYSSPGIDYYRLQHTRRYRFKRLNSDKGCDCPSCQVGLDMATACVAVERPEEEKSEAIENCAFQKKKQDFCIVFFGICFESNYEEREEVCYLHLQQR